MSNSSVDGREEKRLQALKKLEILDSDPEQEFDALAQAAALVCGTPISLISLIEAERQWFKANVGLGDAREGGRSISFCTHTIQGHGLMEVTDATRDARFADNPMVVGEPHIRFYAGFPLTLSTGENVGSLCVVDCQPRTLSDDKKQVLKHLADAAARAMETRVAALHERRLLAAESRARSILEHSIDAIVTIDCNGVIQHWNGAAERMFGFSAQEAEGHSLDLILTNDQRDFEMDVRTRLRGAETTASINTVRRHKDGSPLSVSVSIGPVVAPDGNVTGATEIIRDITEMARSHAQLVEAEKRVNRLYSATPAMLHSIDAEGRLVSVSDRWLEEMGFEREEVIGQYSSSFLTEQSKIKAKNETLPTFFKLGHCENVEYQMVTKSGAVIDVLLSAILERDDTGKPLRTMAIIENVTYRREVENALRDERRRLKQILEATRAGTWEWNIQTGEVRLNAQWGAIIGYALEELGLPDVHTWQSRIHPDDAIESHKRLDAHLAGLSDEYECETRLRHKDGSWVWVLGRGCVLSWTDDGKPEWMYGTHQDISRRKKREEELRKSEDFLERTGRLAGVGGWEVDVVNEEIFWSNETCRIHGVEPGYKPTLAEAVNFYAPEARPVIEAAIEKSIATGEGWDVELPFIKMDGERIWVRAVGSAQFESGKPVRMVGAFQDVTEQVTQRIALEQVNERIAIATRNGRIGVWDANLDTGKTLYSDIWCELIGYRPGELSDSGTQWLDLIHPDDVDRALHADVAHLKGEAPYFEEQFRMRHKDGHWVWILDRGQVTARNDQGEPMRMIGTHTDITRQKQDEEERVLMGERMAIAADSGGIGIWEVDLREGSVHWDDWMYELYGLSERIDIPIGDLWRKQMHPDDLARMETAVRRAMENANQMDEEFRIFWPDNTIRHLHVSAKVHSGKDGTPQRLIGATWDVTTQRELALELAEQHELMRVTLNSIGDAVITTDAQGCVQWLNPVAEYMTGWAVEEARGQPSSRVFAIVHEVTREEAYDPIKACLERGRVTGLAEETMLIARDGREYSIEDSAAPIRSAAGEVLGAVLVFHDVSEQRRLSREMSYRATHDQLTGLVNRSEFDRRLNQVFKRAQTEAIQSTLLYLDLDQFKIVNDTCGHAVGDELLKQVSKLLANTVRSGDTTARLGGDEFAVILEHCGAEVGERIAKKICDRMSDYRFIHDGQPFRVGASIGLVPIDNTSHSVAVILQAADTSCYVAKSSGRNRVHVWKESDEEMQARSGETRWATRIERALEENRFVLHGQKIAALSDELPCQDRIELLLRMIDEDGEVVMPNSFLPSAERFSLSTRIDNWVLSNVLLWMQSREAAWQNRVICVNLSGHSLGDRSFHQWAIEKLDAAGDAVCNRLCLEITETALITNMADALVFIEAVRSRGVTIALDDFGAGVSSFGYLKRFPIDYLKIDGQFVQGLIGDELNEAAIRCFVDVAKVLGVKTVAEFVANEEVACRLRTLGVDYAQGYYIHKPEAISGFPL
ncbi:PAS domain-containing protein [Oricola sp.]|uniref:PAS domain-containing protein n=1 Tax=Oricola sp. TaxID=1979950 RepID=UPI0025F5A99D|nr:PAS domain-containing protein [Oricola sp.]MCI5076872.1 PAS domain-containing protein [Oricola sp.]